MGNLSIKQSEKYGTDVCDGNFKIRQNQGITQAMAEELGLSKKECKSMNKSIWTELTGYIEEQNSRNIKKGKAPLFNSNINFVEDGREIKFDKDIWDKITYTVNENVEGRKVLNQKNQPLKTNKSKKQTSFKSNKSVSTPQSAQKIKAESKMVELTEEEAKKKKKRKRIITGIAIGATIALAAGLAIADIRRPNSIIKGLIKKTGLGKDIKEGMDFAREAHGVSMEPLEKNDGLIEKIIGRLKQDGVKKLEDLTNDKDFLRETADYAKQHIEENRLILDEIKAANSKSQEIFKELFEKMDPSKLKELDGVLSQKQIAEIKNIIREGGTSANIFESMQAISGDGNKVLKCLLKGADPQKVKELEEALTKQNVLGLQRMIELSGTGSTKVAQILSENPSAIEAIERISPDLAQAMKNTKTSCSFSRTMEDAAKFLEESFSGKGYVLEKELGAGTIGATYLAKAPDGSQIVVKMLKNGVTKESLNAEQEMIGKLIERIGSSEAEITELKKMSDGLYKDWVRELDLFKSMKNSEELAKGAKRFSVAKVLEVAPNGRCLVMEKAKGIECKKLIEEILADYKKNPAEFHTKYADLIKKNPWLADPEKVIKELPNTLLKTFDEQFLFLKKGGTSLMHGDPHTGNFFISADAKGRLIPEFIDTDNCVLRSAKSIRDDLSFFSNYFVGNSKKVAEYFVNQCECPAEDKAKLIEAVANDLKTHIFDKKCNLNNATVALDNIKTILKKNGLNLSIENATAMKSQLQHLSNVWSAAALSGARLDIFTIIKDIPKALWSMLKAHVNPISCIKDAIKFATHNVKTAVGSAYQFLIKDAKQVV